MKMGIPSKISALVADQWTPQRLRDLFLDKLVNVKVTRTTLRNESHYPIEETALADLRKAILQFIEENMG